MTLALSALNAFCHNQGSSKTYWIAFSGGLDSSVLLALAAELSRTHSLSFRVIHVDHRLQLNSTKWAQFAKQTAASYGLPYTECIVTETRQEGESVESYARRARYALFANVLQRGDVLLTAHHQDDQAETILLRLMRGAGVKGLGGMLESRPLGKAMLGRPLLSISKAMLRDIAEQKQLAWVEDESNTDTVFARNYLRANIMPLLTARWPKATQLLARSAAHCAATQQLVDDYIDEYDARGNTENTLSISKLLAFKENVRFALIRQWIMQAGYYPPEQKKMYSIEATVLKSRWDKSPKVVFSEGVAIRRYRDEIYLVSEQVEMPFSASCDIIWSLDDENECVIPAIGCLQAFSTKGGDQGSSVPSDVASLNVRFVSSSERIAVMGRGRRHSVKNLFQEWGVPPWLRHRTPFLFLRDELIGVPGYYWYPVWQNQHTDSATFKIIFHINL